MEYTTVDNVFIPNVWCEITDTIELKLKAMECYKSRLKAFLILGLQKQLKL